MGFVSHRVEGSDLEAGDHIYTWRIAFAYSHHGIYVGENRVVHFTHNIASGSSSSGPSSFSSSVGLGTACAETPDCGFRKDGSDVVMSCLNCFVKTGSLYRYKYGVRKRTLLAQIRGGTCTRAKPDPPETVVHRATYLLHHRFFKYNLVTNNCEDFALYCRTGRLVFNEKREGPMGSSGQVRSAKSFASLGYVGILPDLYVKYAKDIGVRKDAVEVRVEDIHLIVVGFEIDDSDADSDGAS